MSFLLALAIVFISASSFFVLLKKFVENYLDDLEKIILSIVSTFTFTPVFLIFLNLSFGIKFSSLLIYLGLLIPIILAAFLLFRERMFKKFVLEVDWREIGILISLVIVYLLLIRPYFAKNTLWADEGLDEVTAVNLIEIGKYKVTTNELYATMHRSPFNPFSLAMFYSLFGEKNEVLYSYNVFYGILSILLIHLIGRRLFSKTAGYISAFLTIFSTLFLFYSLRFLTEIPQIFITAFSTYLAVLVFLEKKYSYLPFLATIIGISFLIKPVLLVLIPAYLFGFFVIEKKSFRIIKTNWKRILISFLLIAIVLSPYFLYSLRETGDALQTTKFYYSGNLGEQQKMHFLWFITNSTWIYSSFSIVILAILGILFGLKSDKVKFLSFSLFFIYLIISAVLSYKEDRYIIFVYPLVFPLAAFPFHYLISRIKEVALGDRGIIYVSLLVLGSLAFHGTVLEYKGDTKNLIEYKIPSYSDLQEGGRYLGKVMNPDEIAISSSGPELGYYGKRKTLYINTNLDKFKEQVKKYNVTYVAMTAFEASQLYFDTLRKYSEGKINASKPENAYEYLLTSGKFEIVHIVKNSQMGTAVIIFKRNVSLEEL